MMMISIIESEHSKICSRVDIDEVKTIILYTGCIF